MLDRYVYGDALRLSAEAPVPIILHQKTEYRLGGAANVAANIKALGGIPWLVGLAGKDDSGIQLDDLLRQAGIASAILDSDRQTTLKTRIIANQQQIARIDYEDVTPFSAEVPQRLMECLKSLVPAAGAVVISDYAKGVISRDTISGIVDSKDQRTPLFVDPKVANGTLYTGLSI